MIVNKIGGGVTILGKEIELGKEIYLTDPCYDTDTWCQSLVKNVKEGTWLVDYEYESFENENQRVSLSLANKDYEYTYCNYRYIEIDCLGVDSGNLGVFDKKYYEESHKDIDTKDKWYDKYVMGQDFDKRYVIITDNKGVFCRTLYGDGEYMATLYINDDNEIIGIEIEM